jgi:proline iminopeptidase
MTPDSFTLQELMLPVGDGHELYVQDWGNPKAKLPIIYLHGGPGNGVSNRDKQLFNPDEQRVIFFDQRGCGNSLPQWLLEHNTTQDLVEDIEKVRQHLKLDQFMLAGGSWGSTLALVYGITYPKQVAAMVLNGILTGNQEEIDWFGKGGYREFFPDVWEQYQSSVPKEYKNNPSTYHFEQAFSDDQEAVKRSAYAYESMEARLLRLDDSRVAPADYETYDPSMIRIEMHYLKNRCFLPDNYVFDNVDKLTMPIWLIQGRYDMICRPNTAYRLDKFLPDSHLVWTINGHSGDHESRTIQNLLRLHVAGGK